MKRPHEANRKEWKDPVKDVPAGPETLAIKGDFGKFTKLMTRVVKAGKTTSASPGPVASS